MSDTRYKFLFYVTLSYSYSILRPIEKELIDRGYSVAWFVRANTEAAKFLRASDKVLQAVSEVKKFNADALLAPGNSIPSFFPGIKIQVFHGFDSGKNNKFKIRDFFDLYCTQGPMTTDGFNKQRALMQKPTFDVVETGWSKLDALFTLQPEAAEFSVNTKQILYAPTFSPKLTSTYDLLDEIQRLSKKKEWFWLVKFHPKVTQEEVAMYKALESDNFRVIDTDDIIPLLQSADVLLSDTSSILSEFSLQNKAVISYNGRQSADWVIDFSEPKKLEESILKALDPDEALLKSIEGHRVKAHPYQDGQSSGRVVDAVEKMIEKGIGHLNRKPLNLFRNLKMRKKLGYYGL